MYRRRVKKPPPQVFPDTLEELGFTINNEGLLIDESDATLRVMNKRLEDEFDLIKLKVPLDIKESDNTSPQANIMLSSDAKECKRLLVLIPGTMEPLGAWSRRLLCNRNVELGSMFSVVKQAREKDFGIVIHNPNTHWWVNGRPSVMVPTTKDYGLIPHLNSPEEHVDYVLRNIVQNSTSQEIFFIAHKYGAHALMQALHNQFDAFKNRVSGIAVVDGTHTIDSFPEPDFRKWWSLNAVGYAQSEEVDKDKIEYKQNAGCNCVNAGTQEVDFTLVSVMPDIFRFFNARRGRDNKFENYKDKLQSPNEDDPTTIMVVFEDNNTPSTENEFDNVEYQSS
ncbi:hypothetical protein BGX27_003274 [Mortierella sp. AM989]|nr:hypothetical protein BGX27_003274 [Mortierella sp. AM989]